MTKRTGWAGFLAATCVAMVLMLGACRAGSRATTADAPQGAKENAVMIYPMLGADYQFTSSQEQTPAGGGRRAWFVPNAAPDDPAPPRAILLSDAGLTVVYPRRIERRGPDGSLRWTQAQDGGMPVLLEDDRVCFRNTAFGISAVDAAGAIVLEDFFVPSSTPLGWLQTVRPEADGRFLVQAMNRAREEVLDGPDHTDEYSLVLMGPDGFDDWVYFKRYGGEAVPGPLTRDGTRFVLASTRGQVRILDVKDGSVLADFTLPETTLRRICLDRADRIVAVLTDPGAPAAIAGVSLQGTVEWRFALPAAPPDPLLQAPAVAHDGRILYAQGGQLYALDAGTPAWQAPIPPAASTFLTVLGDDSVLIAAGNTVTRLDRDGKQLFVSLLDPDGEITTPPVVDEAGNIYVGTAEGIHCLR